MSNDTESFDAVLFESDKTCCVCRDPALPVQIHHIDFNHQNDERSNLAVVCDRCQKLAHTKTPFSRNLTPGQVRLYDKSWRAICATRLLPQDDNQEDARELEEYRQEVLLEISLTCHLWKNSYMALYPGNFRGVTGDFTDVWEMLIETAVHEDSEKELEKYHSLFDTEIDLVTDELDSLLMTHGDVVPTRLKTLVIRTIRQLKVEKNVFKFFGPNFSSLKMRTEGVLSALAQLAREAEKGTEVSPVVHYRE